ncbi:hypothetical protein, partial [Escherichia coli]|uniref:hypothetical protein n=1 Tax=Escherichia coli TaxID=562 RepID=UPI001B7D8514
GPKTSIICSPMTSLKTSIKTITYLSDTGCLEIQGASLLTAETILPITDRWLSVSNNYYCNAKYSWHKLHSSSVKLVPDQI